MDAVLSGLRLRNGKEQEAEARSVGRDKADLSVGLVMDVPVQRGSPEARQTRRIVGVEAKSDESSTQLEPPSSATPGGSPRRSCPCCPCVHRRSRRSGISRARW